MTAPTNLAVERRSRRSFTASDVLACTGITYRQLDYWTRTGLLTRCYCGTCPQYAEQMRQVQQLRDQEYAARRRKEAERLQKGAAA